MRKKYLMSTPIFPIFRSNVSNYEENIFILFPSILIAVKEDISSVNDTISVIAYIGSPCCYNINKKIKCKDVNFVQTPFSDGDIISFNHSLI